MFSKINDEFIRLLDNQDKEKFSIHTLIKYFYPKCVKIANINLITLKECYEDIPLTFILNNKLEKGFLTKDRVIRLHSKPITCTNFPIYVPLLSLNKTINQKIELVDSKNVKFDKFDYYDHALYKNLSHLDSLLNGVDILGQIHNLT